MLLGRGGGVFIVEAHAEVVITNHAFRVAAFAPVGGGGAALRPPLPPRLRRRLARGEAQLPRVRGRRQARGARLQPPQAQAVAHLGRVRLRARAGGAGNRKYIIFTHAGVEAGVQQ